MQSQYLLCAISSVEPAGDVKLDCRDALTGAVTHITASSVREAEAIVFRTFFSSVVLATTLLLLLVTLRRLAGSARSGISRREWGKTVSLGSRSPKEA